MNKNTYSPSKFITLHSCGWISQHPEWVMRLDENELIRVLLQELNFKQPV